MSLYGVLAARSRREARGRRSPRRGCAACEVVRGCALMAMSALWMLLLLTPPKVVAFMLSPRPLLWMGWLIGVLYAITVVLLIVRSRISRKREEGEGEKSVRSRRTAVAQRIRRPRAVPDADPRTNPMRSESADASGERKQVLGVPEDDRSRPVKVAGEQPNVRSAQGFNRPRPGQAATRMGPATSAGWCRAESDPGRTPG